MAFAIFVSAQTKKVSILGDSYSTFQGMNPEGYAPFYPNDKNDVTKVEQTWWSLYIKAMGYELEKNNSWGGTTICNTGYGGMDATANSFNARYELLGNPDIIFVFGGTNDAWARSPIGEYKYADWTKDDCKAFRLRSMPFSILNSGKRSTSPAVRSASTTTFLSSSFMTSRSRTVTRLSAV